MAVIPCGTDTVRTKWTERKAGQGLVKSGPMVTTKCPGWQLVLCQRVVYRNGAILLIVGECSGFILRRFRPHGS